MKKTPHNTNVADLQIVGNGDLWQLLCEVSSESGGWMKSTKVMEIRDASDPDDPDDPDDLDEPEECSVDGCLVQVTTQQGDYVAEALTYVPNVRIAECGTKLEHFDEW